MAQLAQQETKVPLEQQDLLAQLVVTVQMVLRVQQEQLARQEIKVQPAQLVQQEAQDQLARQVQQGKKAK